jgi:hypothetical protein
MNKNYIIWADSRGLPTKTHASYELALSEATRLAKKHPEVAFNIYGLVGSAIGHTGVDFTPVPETVPAPKNKPEGVDLTLLGIGSTVRLRDGRKKALVDRYVAPSLGAEIFVFSDLGLFDGGTVGHVYTYANGRFYLTGESADDVVEIIAEKRDGQAEKVDLSEIRQGQALRRRDGGVVYFTGFKLGGFWECRARCATVAESRYSWVDVNGSADPTGRSVAADIVEIIRAEDAE